MVYSPLKMRGIAQISRGCGRILSIGAFACAGLLALVHGPAQSQSAPDYNSAQPCLDLGGRVTVVAGQSVCSGIDRNDTFCFVGSADAFPCRGLYKHVETCNMHGRPALNPFFCGKCGEKESGAVGAKCTVAFGPAGLLAGRSFTATLAGSAQTGTYHGRRRGLHYVYFKGGSDLQPLSQAAHAEYCDSGNSPATPGFWRVPTLAETAGLLSDSPAVVAGDYLFPDLALRQAIPEFPSNDLSAPFVLSLAAMLPGDAPLYDPNEYLINEWNNRLLSRKPVAAGMGITPDTGPVRGDVRAAVLWRATPPSGGKFAAATSAESFAVHAHREIVFYGRDVVIPCVAPGDDNYPDPPRVTRVEISPQGGIADAPPSIPDDLFEEYRNDQGIVFNAESELYPFYRILRDSPISEYPDYTVAAALAAFPIPTLAATFAVLFRDVWFGDLDQKPWRVIDQLDGNYHTANPKFTQKEYAALNIHFQEFMQFWAQAHWLEEQYRNAAAAAAAHVVYSAPGQPDIAASAPLFTVSAVARRWALEDGKSKWITDAEARVELDLQVGRSRQVASGDQGVISMPVSAGTPLDADMPAHIPVRVAASPQLGARQTAQFYFSHIPVSAPAQEMGVMAVAALDLPVGANSDLWEQVTAHYTVVATDAAPSMVDLTIPPQFLSEPEPPRLEILAVDPASMRGAYELDAENLRLIRTAAPSAAMETVQIRLMHPRLRGELTLTVNFRPPNGMLASADDFVPNRQRSFTVYPLATVPLFTLTSQIAGTRFDYLGPADGDSKNFYGFTLRFLDKERSQIEFSAVPPALLTLPAAPRASTFIIAQGIGYQDARQDMPNYYNSGSDRGSSSSGTRWNVVDRRQTAPHLFLLGLYKTTPTPIGDDDFQSVGGTRGCTQIHDEAQYHQYQPSNLIDVYECPTSRCLAAAAFLADFLEAAGVGDANTAPGDFGCPPTTEAEYVVGDYFEAGKPDSLNPIIRAQNEDRCMSAEDAQRQGLIRDGAPMTAPDGTTPMTYCPAPRRNAKVLLAARHSDYQDVPLSSSYSYSYTAVTVTDSGAMTTVSARSGAGEGTIHAQAAALITLEIVAELDPYFNPDDYIHDTVDRVRSIFERFKRPDDYPALTAPGYASRALPVSTEDLTGAPSAFLPRPNVAVEDPMMRINLTRGYRYEFISPDGFAVSMYPPTPHNLHGVAAVYVPEDRPMAAGETRTGVLRYAVISEELDRTLGTIALTLSLTAVASPPILDVGRRDLPSDAGFENVNSYYDSSIRSHVVARLETRVFGNLYNLLRAPFARSNPGRGGEYDTEFWDMGRLEYLGAERAHSGRPVGYATGDGSASGLFRLAPRDVHDHNSRPQIMLNVEIPEDKLMTRGIAELKSELTRAYEGDFLISVRYSYPGLLLGGYVLTVSVRYSTRNFTGVLEEKIRALGGVSIDEGLRRMLAYTPEDLYGDTATIKDSQGNPPLDVDPLRVGARFSDLEAYVEKFEEYAQAANVIQVWAKAAQISLASAVQMLHADWRNGTITTVEFNMRASDLADDGANWLLEQIAGAALNTLTSGDPGALTSDSVFWKAWATGIYGDGYPAWTGALSGASGLLEQLKQDTAYLLRTGAESMESPRIIRAVAARGYLGFLGHYAPNRQYPQNYPDVYADDVRAEIPPDAPGRFVTTRRDGSEVAGVYLQATGVDGASLPMMAQEDGEGNVRFEATGAPTGDASYFSAVVTVREFRGANSAVDVEVYMDVHLVDKQVLLHPIRGARGILLDGVPEIKLTTFQNPLADILPHATGVWSIADAWTPIAGFIDLSDGSRVNVNEDGVVLVTQDLQHGPTDYLLPLKFQSDPAILGAEDYLYLLRLEIR